MFSKVILNRSLPVSLYNETSNDIKNKKIYPKSVFGIIEIVSKIYSMLAHIYILLKTKIILWHK